VTVLARADGVLGELVLRGHEGGVVDLVSNGVFLMDSAVGEPPACGGGSTERHLATVALAASEGEDLRVLVGGLGLGLTAQAVLADRRVGEVTVVEIEPHLVTWVRAGLVPSAAGLLDDARVRVVLGDVVDVVPDLPEASVDVALLDVDNGPGFLAHPANARVYRGPFLTSLARRLRVGGVVAVWSADADPRLGDVLTSAVGACATERLVVRRAGRELEYWLYLARRR
jgi:spermidine synthase